MGLDHAPLSSRPPFFFRRTFGRKTFLLVQRCSFLPRLTRPKVRLGPEHIEGPHAPLPDAIARQLNQRPRKTLGFRTSAEMFDECVALTGLPRPVRPRTAVAKATRR
ncbi:MAG TPA: hypothetical protein DDZ62_13325 [Delftia acidovorans]|nr:hypothetical protein [Delftia acidovorans]